MNSHLAISQQAGSPPASSFATAGPEKPVRRVLRVLARVVLAGLLLLPIAGEAWMRSAGAKDIIFAAYLIACVIFALVASRLAPSSALREQIVIQPLLIAAALAMFAAGVYLATKDLRQWALLPIWLAGVAFWIVAWLGQERKRVGSSRAMVLLWALLAVAAALRLFQLGDLQTLYTDELVAAPATLEVGSSADFLLFQVDRGGLTQTRLMEYITLGVFKLAEISVFTLRLPTVARGLLEIVLVYLMGRELFAQRVGLIAAAVLTTLTAHLHFSRNGYAFIDGAIVWTLTAFFLARGFSRRSVASLAMAGLSLSLALFLYIPGRPAVVFVAAVLLLAALDSRVRGSWLAVGSLALVGGFLVGSGPMLVPYIRDPGILTFRSELSAWLFQAIEAYRSSGDISRLSQPLWEHLSRGLLGYNLNASTENFYKTDRGLLMLLPAGLMFAGLSYATLRMFDWRLRLLAVWFWAVTLGLWSATDVVPSVHRGVPVLAAVALLVALGLDRLIAGWEAVSVRLRRFALPVLMVVTLAMTVPEGAYYFSDFAKRDIDPYQDQLVRYILASPPGRHFVLVPGPSPIAMELNAIGKPFRWAGELGQRNTGKDLGRAIDELPELVNRPEGVTYLVHAERQFWLDVIKQFYPAGRTEQLRSREGKPVWIAYTVDADALSVHRGLRLKIADASGRSDEMRTETLEIAGNDLPAGLRYPIDLEWRAWLRFQREGAGTVEFASSGSVAPTIRLGEAVVESSKLAGGGQSPVRLARGVYPLVVTARLAGPADSVRLTWDGVKQKDMRLFPSGLSFARLFEPSVVLEWFSQDGGRLVRREFDVMIADHNLAARRPSPDPYLLRWTGVLKTDEPGRYEFEVRADGPVRLMIDGRQVWPATGDQPRQPDGPLESRRAKVDLVAGSHRLALERAFREGAQVILLWRLGDGEQAIVPAKAFASLPWP